MNVAQKVTGFHKVYEVGRLGVEDYTESLVYGKLAAIRIRELSIGSSRTFSISYVRGRQCNVETTKSTISLHVHRNEIVLWDRRRSSAALAHHLTAGNLSPNSLVNQRVSVVWTVQSPHFVRHLIGPIGVKVQRCNAHRWASRFRPHRKHVAVRAGGWIKWR